MAMAQPWHKRHGRRGSTQATSTAAHSASANSFHRRRWRKCNCGHFLKPPQSEEKQLTPLKYSSRRCCGIFRCRCCVAASWAIITEDTSRRFQALKRYCKGFVLVLFISQHFLFCIIIVHGGVLRLYLHFRGNSVPWIPSDKVVVGDQMCVCYKHVFAVRQNRWRGVINSIIR